MFDIMKLRAIPTEHLESLNRAVVAEIKARRALKQMSAARSLVVGQKVKFFARKNQRTVNAVVTQINRVSAHVDEVDANGAVLCKWRVPPSMLTPI
jgi:hypothetical protein